MEEEAAGPLLWGRLRPGRLVVAGPAGGKTTVARAHPTQVVDPEIVITFTQDVLLKNGCYRGISNMWEESLDLLSLFFKCALPVIMGGLKTGRLVLGNLIGSSNEFVVNKLLKGLSASGYDVSFYLVDDEVLEERTAKRSQENGNHPISFISHRKGHTWTHQCHILLRGIAADADIPIIRHDLASLVPPSVPLLSELPPSALRSFRWIEIENESSSEHVLLEVLPHVFIEYVQGVPGFFYIVDVSASSKKELVLRCSYSSKLCVATHGKTCTTRLHVISLPPTTSTTTSTPTTTTSTTQHSCKTTIYGAAEREGIISRRSDEGQHCDFTACPSICLNEDYIPTYKLQHTATTTTTTTTTTSDNTPLRYCVLAYYGSFAPLHLGHLEALQIAKEDRESQGYVVLGAYLCPHPKVSSRKSYLIDNLQQPWRHRAAMADFLLWSHPWAMLDTGVFSGTYDFKSSEGFFLHPVHSIAPRLRNCITTSSSTTPTPLAPTDNLTVFWVNGSDGFYAHYYFNEDNFRKAVGANGDRVELLVVDRKDTPSNFNAANIKLGEFIHRAARAQETQFSSTEIRRLVAQGQFTKAAKLLGNDAAAAYLYWLWHEHEKTREASS